MTKKSIKLPTFPTAKEEEKDFSDAIFFMDHTKDCMGKSLTDIIIDYYMVTKCDHKCGHITDSGDTEVLESYVDGNGRVHIQVVVYDYLFQNPIYDFAEKTFIVCAAPIANIENEYYTVSIELI